MNHDDSFFRLPRSGDSTGAAPAGGGPPGRPRPAWPLLALGAAGLVVIGGLAGYWAFLHVLAHLRLHDQPLTLRLPPQTDIVMSTDHRIDVQMQGVIHAQVPLVQTLDLPVQGRYDTIIDLDTQAPLKTTIVYEGVIPVNTMADIEAKAPVNFQNVKKYKNLHFKARLPMKLRLPIKLTVPVDQMIRLKYHGPLKVAIDHVIQAPVDTVLHTALNVDQEFSVPVTASLPLRLDLPQHPVRATITDADLNLDLATLRLERKPADAAP